MLSSVSRGMHSHEWGGGKLAGQLTLEVPSCEATVWVRRLRPLTCCGPVVTHLWVEPALFRFNSSEPVCPSFKPQPLA